MVGFPSKARSLLCKVLPEFMARTLEELDPERQGEVFEVVLGEHFDDLGPKVVTFGLIDTKPDIQQGSYVYCSNSGFLGVSGGPVVAVDRPDVLIGIAARSPNNTRGSIFLSTQDQALLAMYKALIPQ